jgi:hypothetical protein
MKSPLKLIPWNEAPALYTQERVEFYKKYNLAPDHTLPGGGSGQYYRSAQDAYDEGYGSSQFDLSSQNFTDPDNDGLLGGKRRDQVVSSSNFNSRLSSDFLNRYRNQQVNTTDIIGDNAMKDAVLNKGVTNNTNVVADAAGGGFGANFKSNMMKPMAMAGMARGIGGILQGAIGRGARRDAQIKAQGQYDDMLAEYRSLDTSNLYADFENQFTGLENAYEDLTVNRQQAEFEKDMFQQQQANIMQGLKGAAGGSGIAGLAQAMANQGQIAAQRAGASIGLQESKINMLRAQEASRLQQLERTGATQAEQLRLAGAERARGLDYMQTSTQLGMAQQDLAAKNRAIAQADAALYGGIGQVAGTALTAAISDRKLKKNINLIGKSPSGLNIYNFEYIDSKYGNGVFQGVMSDEVPSNAVINNGAYDMVNYNMLDVEFKRIN